jgi:hypothetical protein
MVISQIIGGLGNQMFQYAAGRALALRKKTTFRLDVSGFASYGLRRYELQRIFHCPVEIATEADVREILGWYASPIIQKIVTRLKVPILRSRKIVMEPHFYYWPGINKVLQDCYLVGYWQSEKYFRDVAPKIRTDFTFHTPMSDRNAGVAKQIARVNAVSLHVRRGDYVSNPQTNAAHGLCSLDYYRTAIRHVAERIERPHFFIFSDDMAWAKDQLEMDFPCEYVEHNQGDESYNDMRLMSLCQHHIIANSSFSWWGAWLNPNPDKLVIAPKKWFANDNNVEDLFPQGWVAL